MQDAKLSELHSSLAAQEAARGAHGGLGFSGSGAGKKEKKTKAEKSLMSDKTSTGREYATTTAAAVAAGHWDPFARPIEFKMKEVNRRVGGLYSMFVKGGTEGGTLKETAAPATAAAAASSSAGSAFIWKRAILDALSAAPGRQLRLKRLRQTVLAAHALASPQHAAAAPEEAKRTFKKRLKKAAGVTIEGKLVRLTPS
jgi:hypothetical protein